MQVADGQVDEVVFSTDPTLEINRQGAFVLGRQPGWVDGHLNRPYRIGVLGVVYCQDGDALRARLDGNG